MCAVRKESYIYMSQITAEECQGRVNAFLNAHLNDYTEREIKYIKNNAAVLPSGIKNPHFSSILTQIHDEVGLFTKEKSIYSDFLNLLEDHFDINRNIIEVGSGPIPTLAKKIALHQKTGTITVYDPRLIVPALKPDNLIIKREVFRKETEIQNAQMIIGFMPCDATIAIIESATLNQLDFMVALCEGGSRRGYGWLETDEEWTGYIEYLAERNMKSTAMGTLEKTKLYNDSPYPVIYNKRRK